MAYLQSAIFVFYPKSSPNPILYCWKISEVKQAVRETISEVAGEMK